MRIRLCRNVEFDIWLGYEKHLHVLEYRKISIIIFLCHLHDKM